MKDFVPLFQSLLWVGLILTMLLYFRKELGLVKKILTKRLESGSSVKFGPIEIGELKNEVEVVKKDLQVTNERISNLFLTTMSPAMYKNLKKLSSGDFGHYKISKGLKRELYHLRDVGYIDVKSITSIPTEDENLSNFITITETGKQFVELRDNIKNNA